MFGKFSFAGGVHPPHNKAYTESSEIATLPPPEKLIIPLSQHIGAPAKVAVKRNDEVKVGQMIGEAGGFVSAPVHASVSGKVLSVGNFHHPLGGMVTSVEIENDGKDEPVTFATLDKPWNEAAPGELIQLVQKAGVVGMGGASFPTHVKLQPPSEKNIDTLIINGAECEPYLTADHRLLLELTQKVLDGILIIKKILNAQRVVIGIEDNKPDAIAAVEEEIGSGAYGAIELARLATKYPQGGEKQLIEAVAKRQVPAGGLPMDCGCVVQNVGTAYAVRDAVIAGRPLYERVLTVTGPAVRKPANLLVRIGTPISYILDFCEIDMLAARKVIMGGPMMGIAQSDLDAPVIKSTSGLLGLDTVEAAIRAYPCISCGNCVKACPVNLVPATLAKYIAKNNIDAAEEWNVLDCMECGSCSFVCPSKINLVHFIKLGKFHVLAARKKKAASTK
ncbi:MAG: electron transport complex subunit RsxC [Chitinivibrionales bacterium]|nr:electron transport complex subunit RsxC [Chitinivibrionales bacterium]